MLKKFFITALISTCLLLKAMEDEQKEQDITEEELQEEFNALPLPFLIWPQKFCSCIANNSYMLDLILKSKTFGSQFIASNCKLEQIKQAITFQKQKKRQIESKRKILPEVPLMPSGVPVYDMDYSAFRHTTKIISLLKEARKYRYYALLEKLLFWKKRKFPTKQQINKFCSCISNKPESEHLLDIILQMKISPEDLAEKCELEEIEKAKDTQEQEAYEKEWIPGSIRHRPYETLDVNKIRNKGKAKKAEWLKKVIEIKKTQKK